MEHLENHEADELNVTAEQGELAPGLYLVPTPIGNIGDITLRALDTLKKCARVLAEDTRRTGLLLSRLGLKKRLISFHDHNESHRLNEVADWIRGGEAVALVSDAGMPTLSDPGFKLVRELVGLNLPVQALPGPSAILVALAVSGLPTDRFIFEGFLPRKPGKMRKVFEGFREEPRSVIFFESPFRIAKTLALLQATLGNRQVAICREMTKKFEEVLRGDLETLLEKTREKSWKGELTVVLAGV